MKKRRFTIIGGGIIGSAIARELALRHCGNVIVLEKEKTLGMHASGRNSGVLHSGINQAPGSLKARMCVRGNELARTFCKKNNVAMEECGTLVVAKNKGEQPVLDILFQRGCDAGVHGLQMLNEEELKEREPEVIGRKALLSPHGAIVDSLAFLKSVREEAEHHGAEFITGAKALAISGSVLKTSLGEFEAGHIINCAGLYADTVAHMMGVGLQYAIIPFRGDYLRIKNRRIRSMVYRIPDLKFPFLGVHLTKTISGDVIAGPTASLSFGRESYKKEIHWRETVAMIAKRNFWRLLMHRDFLKLVLDNGKVSFSKKAFIDEVRKICPEVAMGDAGFYRSGIRAQMVNRKGEMCHDMLVEFRQDSTHILNAVSPAFTSSLAFAEYIVNTILS